MTISWLFIARLVRNPVVIALAALATLWAYGSWERHRGAVRATAALEQKLERAKAEAERRAADAARQADAEAVKDTEELRRMRDALREVRRTCPLPDDLLERLRAIH